MFIFRRIFDVKLIPAYLVDQVPDTETQTFYSSLASLNRMPTNFVEVVQDDSFNIIGFCWAVLEPTSLEMHVNTVSLLREYQGDGVALKEYIEHLRKLTSGTKIKRVTWATDRPAFYEKLGFKRSKQIFLEYDLTSGVNDG